MRLFVDNLTNVDFSYICPARGLVGETWLASVELYGPLDHQGMVCDFGIVKKVLRQWLDTHIDHCLLVPSRHPSVETQKGVQYTEVILRTDTGNEPGLSTRGPNQAITLIEVASIEPESVAAWCMQELQGVFGSSIQQLKLEFKPESIDGPFYHYSHGLKKHAGNCQRIAHGHRSRILIWRDRELCLQSMRKWAEQWRDIYVGTQQDCYELDEASVSFAYESDQGQFSIRLPRARVYLMDSDTTVENIAQHLAHRISLEYPRQHILVQAFEGINKGAYAEAFAP